MYYQQWYESSLGRLRLVCSDDALVGIWFEGQMYEGVGYDLQAIPVQTTPIIMQTIRWLDVYFSGQQPSLDGLSLAPNVTVFRQRVLACLQMVPYGETVTYQWLADCLAETGPKTAARAIGGAVGHNPLAIIIPCHRVIGSSGRLTGYAGGIDRKIDLLVLEGHDREQLEKMR